MFPFLFFFLQRREYRECDKEGHAEEMTKKKHLHRIRCVFFFNKPFLICLFCFCEQV